jgi:thiamine pyrophosphokinase
MQPGPAPAGGCAHRATRRKGEARLSCAVFLNGEYDDEDFYLRQFAAAQVVVAADGGHRFLRRQGLWPRLLVGDFDSLDVALVAAARAAGVEVVEHPVRKDETDGELAVAQAAARWPDEIVLLGALGGALDHILGHVCILRGLAARGRAGRIASPSLAATVVQAPATLRLGAAVGARVSLVALSSGVVLTLRGLEYELTGESLPADVCRGLSNRVAVAGARIEVSGGQLLAMVFDGAETFSPATPAPDPVAGPAPDPATGPPPPGSAAAGRT